MPELAFYRLVRQKCQHQMKTGKFFSVWVEKMEFKNSKPAKLCTGTQETLVYAHPPGC